jgi:SAM-dependent methyltransferase
MNQKEYFNYLKGRSFLADQYRSKLLYPALSRQFVGKVLDIGCGIGDFLSFRKNTIGIDINPYNVAYCKERNLEAYVIENGIYPFDNRTFNGAILDNVLEHLTDPAPTLREAGRILQKGGVFIVGVPGKKGYTMDDDHKHFYDEEGLTKLLAKFDFRLKRFVYGPAFIKSQFLSNTLSQYCVYGVFEKIS